jgi:hypothetical protein
MWPGGKGTQFPILPAASGQAQIASKDNASSWNRERLPKAEEIKQTFISNICRAYLTIWSKGVQELGFNLNFGT